MSRAWRDWSGMAGSTSSSKSIAPKPSCRRVRLRNCAAPCQPCWACSVCRNSSAPRSMRERSWTSRPATTSLRLGPLSLSASQRGAMARTRGTGQPLPRRCASLLRLGGETGWAARDPGRTEQTNAEQLPRRPSETIEAVAGAAARALDPHGLAGGGQLDDAAARNVERGFDLLGQIRSCAGAPGRPRAARPVAPACLCVEASAGERRGEAAGYCHHAVPSGVRALKRRKPATICNRLWRLSNNCHKAKCFHGDVCSEFATLRTLANFAITHWLFSSSRQPRPAGAGGDRRRRRPCRSWSAA